MEPRGIPVAGEREFLSHCHTADEPHHGPPLYLPIPRSDSKQIQGIPAAYIMQTCERKSFTLLFESRNDIDYGRYVLEFMSIDQCNSDLFLRSYAIRIPGKGGIKMLEMRIRK